MISRRAWLAGAAAATGCGPKLAKRFNGYAVVANRGSRSLALVNLTRFRAEKQISLPAPPESVLPHAEGRAALVLLPDAGSVFEVPAEQLAISRRQRVAGHANAMRLSNGGQQLWVLSNEPRSLTPVELKSWNRGRSIPLPFAANDFDVSADGRTAAVSYTGRRQFGIIDLPSGNLRTVDLAAEAGIVRFRPDGKQILLGSAVGRTVTIADRATSRVLVMLTLPFSPERFCFSTDQGGQLFVTGQGMDAVGIVYPYQTELAETVLAGREPGAMTVNDTLLFVTNPPTGDTTVIAIAERQVVAKIESGQQPCAVVLTPDGEYALILNRKSGDLAVVRLSKLTDLRYKRAPLFTVVAVGDEPVSLAVVRL